MKLRKFLSCLILSLAVFIGVEPMASQFEDGLNAASRGEFEIAFRLWQPLALQGNAAAQNNMGYMFQRGEGVPRDDPSAAKWWLLAASNGLADAQNNIGVCYADGRGVSQSYLEAVKWYLKAADQGHSNAQSNMGASYGAGWGVNQDWSQSTKWYRLAAEQGDPLGQSNLGVAYANGQGVQRDFVQAYFWYTLALIHFPDFDKFGRERAQSNRAAIARWMSASEIESAQKTALQWKPKQ